MSSPIFSASRDTGAPKLSLDRSAPVGDQWAWVGPLPPSEELGPAQWRASHRPPDRSSVRRPRTFSGSSGRSSSRFTGNSSIRRRNKKNYKHMHPERRHAQARSMFEAIYDDQWRLFPQRPQNRMFGGNAPPHLPHTLSAWGGTDSCLETNCAGRPSNEAAGLLILNPHLPQNLEF